MAMTQNDIQTALARNQLVDITTTGRRSGQPRRLEIMMHNIGGRLYISGMPSPRRRSWLANLAADPRLTLHLKQGARADLAATARIIEDEEERRTVLTTVARNWRRGDVETMVRQSPLIEVAVGSPAGAERAEANG
jgi:deazaflavin-dependent oxidoreductase (nitroreductase family)